MKEVMAGEGKCGHINLSFLLREEKIEWKVDYSLGSYLPLRLFSYASPS